jgi:pSer/pThr/pTyr-binding forkhead associated (FHA) protein
MWKLVIEDDEGKRTVVPLTRDQYTIGRKEGNAIRLTERNVSRDHARLARKNGAADPDRVTYLLDDLTSYNGVYVNGLRVAAQQELSHGDLIQIGDYRVVLQDDSISEAITGQAQPADLKATVPGSPQARSASHQQAAQLLERPNRLVMLAGPTPGAEFPLDRERMTIGRAEDATISINHNSVSRLHCEVHALGDGRFEIVDKGSSNGVRVNSAELRRGIIEDGDVIELGDVRFKFVGAGKVFRPGATESQQLSAIGHRTAAALVTPRKSASVVPYVVFGAVVAAGAVGAWAITRPKPDPVISPVPLASASTEPVDQATVASALQLCMSGDCDTAYEKILNELPEQSAVRSSADVKTIVAKWADRMLERSEAEPDVEKKKALLSRVERAPLIDPERRLVAAEKLRVLTEYPAAPASVIPPVHDVAPRPERADAGPRRSANTSPGQTPGASAAPSPVRSPTASAPAQGDMDKVRQLMLQGPPGYAQARTILEPKVYGNRASADEINALKAICKGQGDKLCYEHCKQLLNPGAP